MSSARRGRISLVILHVFGLVSVAPFVAEHLGKRMELMTRMPLLSKRFTNRLESSGIRVINSIRLPKCAATKGATDTNPNTCKITNEIRPLRADDIVVLTDNQNMPAM